MSNANITISQGGIWSQCSGKGEEVDQKRREKGDCGKREDNKNFLMIYSEQEQLPLAM